MMSYEPLWRTMEEKGVTTYFLMKYCKIEPKTIYNLKHGKGCTLATLEKLCHALSCRVEDVIIYIPEETD